MESITVREAAQKWSEPSFDDDSSDIVGYVPPEEDDGSDPYGYAYNLGSADKNEGYDPIENPCSAFWTDIREQFGYAGVDTPPDDFQNSFNTGYQNGYNGT